MAQRSRVPQFGNWAHGEETSYTIFFDKARKGTNGPKMINPNDPQENPNINIANAAPAPAPAPASRSRAETEQPRPPSPAIGVRTTNEPRKRRENGDAKQYPNPNLPPRIDNMAGRSYNARNQQPGGRGASYGDPSPRRPAGRSFTPEHSYERSPVHNQPRSDSASPSMDGRYSNEKIHERRSGSSSPTTDGKYSYEMNPRRRSGSTSPTRDGKYSYEKIPRKSDSASPSIDSKYSHDRVYGTPGRSYQRPIFNTPERGPAVPKFGGWDEKNPASADGYTSIFNKVREEKKGMPPQPVFLDSTYDDKASKPARHNSHQGCFPLFPWCRSS